MPQSPPAATPTTGWSSFRRLLTFLAPFKGAVIASMLLSIIIVVARLAIPFQTGRAIDAINDANLDQLRTDVLLLVAAAAIGAGVNASRRLVAGNISLGIEKTLRDGLFGHLSGLSFRFFDRQQTGQLLSRVTSDVSMVRFFLGYGLTYFFMHILTIVLVPVVIIMISPQLSIPVLVLIPIIVLVSMRFSRISHPVLKEVQQRVADVTAHGEETLVGARVVRAFGQENREVERFSTLTARIVEQEYRAVVIQAKYRPLYQLIPNAALAVIVLMSGALVANGTITIGVFFTFFGYTTLLLGPLRIVGNILTRAQRAMASSERLWDLFDAADHVPEPENPLPLAPVQPEGSRITFDGVSFSYIEDRPVLSNVTLDIKPGSTVALLGPTGCGKTTLASMLPRFYDPTSGSIALDGVDVRQHSLHELRKAIGIVDQEPYLFSATVADNLRFGDENATDEAIYAALDAAQARSFVDDLPNGINTIVGERGLTLSGGQRQRLAIARALVSNPRVLILDDATASVDSHVESQITDALDGATQQRTTIIIAHRPSTIALADHIVMMDHGAIADQGTHDELIQRNANYQLIHEQRTSRREFLIKPEAGDSARPGGSI